MSFEKLRSLFGLPTTVRPSRPTKAELADGKLYTIDAALRDHFAPVLRRLGFKGSGRHFRRVVGDTFQAVNVQGSMGGGMFAVNLGLHPLAIPVFFDERLDVKKARSIECEFSQRLSETNGDRWWSYFETRDSVTEAAINAAHVFEMYALPLFNTQSDSRATLFTMTPDQFDDGGRLSGFGNTEPRMALALSRLRRTQGKLEDCRGFALIGLRQPKIYFAGRGIVFDPNTNVRWHGQDELEALAKVTE